LLESLREQRFDCIVSNPPYVAHNDPHLDQGDLRFEPQLALSAGDDGLDIIKRIIRQASEHLVKSGLLIIEHGYDQGSAVRNLMSESGFTGCTTHRDLANIDRVTLARYEDEHQ